MSTREISSTSSYRSTGDDKISPFKVAVLVLVKEYCTARLAQLGFAGPAVDPEAAVQFSPQQCKDFCLLSLELIQCHDITWEEFEIILEPGQYSLSEKTISEFISNLFGIAKDGASGLLDLAESLEKLLMEPVKGKPMIRRDSVLGIFIRKMVLQMDKMSFEATIELGNNLVIYLDKTKSSEDPLDLVQMSRKQAELLVSQQLALLQKNEGLAYSPVNLQKILDRILNENQDFAEANYLGHLNEVRSKDFGEAEKKLHRAYDQGTISIEGLIHSKLPEADNLMNNKSFRYAALNLAYLHANFGHKQQALAALNETVGLSGEAADHSCLQEALVWFCHLEEDPTHRLKMIDRLISKSSESNLHHVASLGLAMWTQDCALSGVDPSTIFEYFHTGDIANCQHSLTDVMLTSLALRAAIWNFYGYPSNALQVSQLLLTIPSGDPTKGNIYFNNENIHLAVCNIALHLSRAAKYREAESVIKFAAGQYSHFQQHSLLWKLSDLHVTFYRTLWLGQWDKADLIVSQLAVFNIDDSLAKKVHLLLRKGDTSSGKNTLDSLEEKLNKSGHSNGHRMSNFGWQMGQCLNLRVQCLMLRSVLLCMRYNYAEALEHISCGLEISKKHHMALQLALVSLQSAEIQLHMGLITNALELVQKYMSTIHTHGSLYQQGLVTLLKARCLLAGTKTTKDDRETQKDDILSLLNRSKKIFEDVEAFYLVKDIVFLKALLFHSLGCEKERNTQAMHFRQLDEQYPVKTSNDILIFIGL